MRKSGRAFFFVSAHDMLTDAYAEYRSMGAAVQDSESAAHGVDASRLYVVDTYQFPGFKLIQMELPVLSIYSYLLISDGKACGGSLSRYFLILDVAKKEGANHQKSI